MDIATLPDLTSPDGSEAASPAADGKLWGLLAQYADVDALLYAATAVRDGGYRCWDCYTPYPVHGLDKAMGVKRTILPWLVLGGGLTGSLVALGLQFYCNSPYMASAQLGLVSGYPMVFSGKPYWSLPANIPIIFELTVLFASLTAFFGVWGLCKLPMLYFPAFSSRRFRRVTDDGLFIIIEARDKAFNAAQCRQLLEGTHCSAFEEIYVKDNSVPAGAGPYSRNGHGQPGNGQASTKHRNVGGHA